MSFSGFCGLKRQYFPCRRLVSLKNLILTLQKQSLHLVFGVSRGKLKQVVITEKVSIITLMGESDFM